MSDPQTRQVEVVIPREAAQYCVHIGAGLLRDVGRIVREIAPASRAAVVCDEAIGQSHGEVVLESLRAAGYATIQCGIRADEAHKTINTVRTLYDSFVEGGLDRGCPVLAVGGGVVGDTVGFAAATFMRGLPFINVPTTLLSMADASVGGKTGVNLAVKDALAKNLIGAFHQPAAVIIDPQTLATLPDRHFRAGSAECVKHALIADADLLDWIERHGPTLRSIEPDRLADFIERNIRIKAAIVIADERELRQRMVLNLGHTFAHAIETRPELDLLHGEAVGLGLIAAAAAGVALQVTDTALPAQLRRLVEALGLPTTVSLPDDESLLATMQRDKKTSDGSIRLIVPIRPGAVEILESVASAAISAGWSAIR